MIHDDHTNMSIPYIHCETEHTLVGPQALLPILFANAKPLSLLDVGCGTGTWLKAGIEFGIPDVLGVDGVKLPAGQLHVSPEKIKHCDLTQPWSLEKRFDVAFCLEVAEHIDKFFAHILIDALVMHSDLILFSAACPGQPGQHHVNCQWPAYWQELFNARAYACEDVLRWEIWEDSRIEPWYRQNIFLARRAPEIAGHEPRIKSVVHPAMWNFETGVLWAPLAEHVRQIEQGTMPVMWGITLPVKIIMAKLKRRLQ